MGWDEDPRGTARNPRMGTPRGPFEPYQPYGNNGSARMPIPGATGRWAAPEPENWTSTQMAALAKQHHFSLFHDGNAGHLWRGEVASLLGDAVFTLGVLVWLVGLTQSAYAVALALALLGVPWLLAGPLAAPLTRISEPGRGLAWIGRLRFVLALGFIPMHFHTVYPIVFALIFAIALFGRLRQALRVAAFRTCLAPGEPERVTSDLYVGGAVVSVLGPLLATLAYILVGERILLVSAFAAICYLLASNSDGFLDALTEQKRAFLAASPDADEVAELLEVDDGDEELDDPTMRRELALPEWYQVAPATVGQGIGDLRAGIGLAGSSSLSQMALLALCALSLIGGGLAALEIFFVQDRMSLPGFYAGPLIAAEAAGLLLGGLLGDLVAARGNGRPAVLVGLIGTGVTLAALPFAPMFLAVLVAALALGLFNGLAVTGARVALFAGYIGIERRAIASAETWLAALCGVIGALLFSLFYAGIGQLGNVPTALAKLPFPGWPVGMVLLGAGVALVVSAFIFMALSLRKPAAARAAGDADAQEGIGGAFGDESGFMPAASGWDDADYGDDGQGGWGDGYEDDDLSSYGPAQGSRYGRGGGGGGGGGAGRSGFGTPNRRGGLLSRNSDDDDSSRRGGSSGRNRW